MKLNVSIGAESQYTRRSVVGRIALELASAVQPATYADRLKLLIDKNIIDASVFAQIGEDSIEHTLSHQPAITPKPIRVAIAEGQGRGAVLNWPEAQNANPTGSLRMLGHVAEADLAILYARAAVFAYIRPYKGFGLPVVEAMATGNAVLASSPTAVGELAKGQRS